MLGEISRNEGEQYALDKLYNERYQEVQRGVDTDWLSQPARTAFFSRSLFAFVWWSLQYSL